MEGSIKVRMGPADAFKVITELKSGECALLYSFAAASGGICELETAKNRLEMDEKQLKKAADILMLYRVLEPAGIAPVNDVEYDPQELLSARKTDPSFSGLCNYLDLALGRGARKSELETLYSIYDRLGLPADVIMVLINYCRVRERLSSRELEKQAYKWHDGGVLTYEAAEMFLEETKNINRKSREMMGIFGIYDRLPSESEEKYLGAWIGMGFSRDMIKLAYDRTVLRTGKLQWGYMNKILLSWQEKGIKTRRQAETLDSQPPQAAAEESLDAFVTRLFDRKRAKRETLRQERLLALRQRSPQFKENEIALGEVMMKRAKLAGKTDPQLEQRMEELLQRRRETLAQYGKDESYIDIPPECPKCGDRGFVGGEMCSCFIEEREKEAERRKSGVSTPI